MSGTDFFQSVENLLIGLAHTAQVAAEAVLVQTLAGRHVPQAAGVGRNLVGQDNPPVGGAAELDFEIDEGDVDAGEELLQNLVDAGRHPVDAVQLLVGHQPQRHGVVVVDEWVAQLVALVADVVNHVRRPRPLLDAEPLRHRPCDDVADDDLERDNRDAAAQLLAFVERADVVGLDPRPGELLEDECRDGVVQNALVHDGGLLDVVERRSRIRIVDDDILRVVRAEHLLGLAVVKLFELLHGLYSVSCVCCLYCLNSGVHGALYRLRK